MVELCKNKLKNIIYLNMQVIEMINVVAAVIKNEEGKILIAQRNLKNLKEVYGSFLAERLSQMNQEKRLL